MKPEDRCQSPWRSLPGILPGELLYVGVLHCGHQPAGDEEEPTRNWRPPQQDTDFAAHAGQAEKIVLQRLEFNLLLDGREIGDFMHGLDGRCFLTKSALSALGIDDYSDLWGESGKVVEKARKLLQAKAHSTAARDQVCKAQCELEQAVFFRQLDVMAWRFKVPAERIYDRKKALQEHKETLRSSKKNEILEKYCGDRLDRERIRQGKTTEITCEHPAETEAVDVSVEPAAESYAKYCTLLNKKGVKALEEKSGAEIKIEITTSTKGHTKGQKVGTIVIKGPTKKSQDDAWKLITRQMELDSDCEKMGLKWIKVGTTRPPEGRERVDKGLATALMTTSELTEEVFHNSGIRDLRGDDFIMSGDSYFKPAVCGKCKHCIRANHFLHLDKVFEAKEKLHALLLPYLVGVPSDGHVEGRGEAVPSSATTVSDAAGSAEGAWPPSVGTKLTARYTATSKWRNATVVRVDNGTNVFVIFDGWVDTCEISIENVRI